MRPGSTPLIVFRADASLQIGTGHVMRCLTLADALASRGAECEFVCRILSGHRIEEIRSRGFRVHPLPAPGKEATRNVPIQPGGAIDYGSWLNVPPEVDAEETVQALRDRRVDWMVVDHYALDDGWEQTIRSAADKIMVIDDLADRPHACDVLLDQNFGRSFRDYQNLVPDSCTLLLGSRYVLLREEFSAVRQRSLARPRSCVPKSILVSMGGGDRCNATGSVLQVLSGCNLPAECSIYVVVYPGSPFLGQIQYQAERMQQDVVICVNVRDMAALMADSDLAIGSGGVTTYERLFLGLPSLVVTLADNQLPHLRRMADAGLFKLFRTEQELHDLVTNTLEHGARTNPSVVSNGTRLVANEIAQDSVVLRSPSPMDLRRTFRWLQDSELRRRFLMSFPPTLARHVRYWRELLQDDTQYVFSVVYNGTHIGNAGIKHVDLGRGDGELWLYIGDAAHRGGGLGRRILIELQDFMKLGLGLSKALLHVSRSNTEAYALYVSSGYEEQARDPSQGFRSKDESIVQMSKNL